MWVYERVVHQSVLPFCVAIRGWGRGWGPVTAPPPSVSTSSVKQVGLGSGPYLLWLTLTSYKRKRCTLVSTHPSQRGFCTSFLPEHISSKLSSSRELICLITFSSDCSLTSNFLTKVGLCRQFIWAGVSVSALSYEWVLPPTIKRRWRAGTRPWVINQTWCETGWCNDDHNRHRLPSPFIEPRTMHFGWIFFFM